MSSTPIIAMKKPMKPASQPFSGVASTDRLPQMVMPNSASRNISHLPNFRAILDRNGVATIMMTTEISVPRKEANTPPKSALPPLPCLASG